MGSHDDELLSILNLLLSIRNNCKHIVVLLYGGKIQRRAAGGSSPVYFGSRSQEDPGPTLSSVVMISRVEIRQASIIEVKHAKPV